MIKRDYDSKIKENVDLNTKLAEREKYLSDMLK